MDKQDKKLILNALMTKQKQLVELLDEANSRQGRKLYRHNLDAYSTLYDKISDDELCESVEVKALKNANNVKTKQVVELGTTPLGILEENILDDIQQAFYNEPSVTGQIQIVPELLHRLSMELGVHLSWHTEFHTPYAKLRVTKGDNLKYSLKVIPDES